MKVVNLTFFYPSSAHKIALQKLRVRPIITRVHLPYNGTGKEVSQFTIFGFCDLDVAGTRENMRPAGLSKDLRRRRVLECTINLLALLTRVCDSTVAAARTKTAVLAGGFFLSTSLSVSALVRVVVYQGTTFISNSIDSFARYRTDRVLQ